MRAGRWIRATAFGLGVLVILLLSTILVLARTGPGRSFVLNRVLDAARARVVGTVEVDRFADGDLFERAGLIGVRVRDPEGRAVLTADSLALGYSALALLAGARELSSLDLYGARLTLRADSAGWNLVQILASPPDSAAGRPTAADSTAVPLTSAGQLVLRNVVLHDAAIEVQPASAEPLRFSAIEAELPRVTVGGVGGLDHAEIFRLGMHVDLLEGSLDVHEFVGSVEREANQLRVDAARLRLPESEVKGGVRVTWSDSTGVDTQLSLAASSVSLPELEWLLPDLPAGRVEGSLTASLARGRSHWAFEDAVFTSASGSVSGDGAVDLSEQGMRLDRVALSARALDLAVLRPWLPDSLWAFGSVDGSARLDGRPERLSVGADLRWASPDRETQTTGLTLDGVARVGRTLGAEDLHVVARFPDFAILRRFGGPGWLEGAGVVDVQVDGTLAEGLEVVGTLLTGSDEVPRSRVLTELRFQRAGQDPMLVNGSVDLSPLRLADLRGTAPTLDLRGEASGRVGVRGSLTNLALTTDLETSGGPLDVEATLTQVGGVGRLEVRGTLADLDLALLSGRVPDRTTLQGSVILSTEFTSGDVTATLDLGPSRIAGIRVTSALSALSVHEGMLQLDSLTARSALGRLDARGTLALVEDGPQGEMEIGLSEGALAGLRPLVFGEEGDLPVGLDDVRRRLEALDGAVADTGAVDLGGTFELRGTLRGSAKALIGEGRVAFTEAVYKSLAVDTATAEVDRFDLRSGDLEARVTAAGVSVFDRTFQTATGTVALAGGSGRVSMEMVREAGTWFAAGVIESDSNATVLNVDQFSLVDRGERWNLGGPARLAWGAEGLDVRGLRLLRPGVETFHLDADGTLPRDGSGSLAVEIRSLDLARISRVIDFQSEDVEGLVDLDLEVTGSLTSPLIEGTLSVRDLRYRVVTFDLLEGDIGYRGRVLNGAVFGWRGGRRAVQIEGSMPADLAFGPVEARVPEGPVRLSLQADSVPLANVLGFFPNYEAVEGELSGNFIVAGTPSNLQPSGSVRLTGGAATLPDFGIRPSQATGTFELTPNGVVTVDATLRERGRARVTGTVSLNPISDPVFDLDIVTLDRDDVRIAARREMDARVAGQVHLGGSYQRPELTGALDVREGVLFLDEFVRAATIVDLSDPALVDFDRDLLSLDPIVRESQNPFVQNLRVTVDVTMAGNAWLRSPEMNVEMSGALLLTFDRSKRTLAMLGDLTALRGTYRVVGRQFDVQGGTVRFLGTPGVNPTLDITALNRLRTDGGGAIDISANVDGTMLRPEVHLTSELPGATREDLISYLLFGRPQAQITQLSSRSGGGSLLSSAGLTLTLGALASQVGSLVADELPFDYLAVSTQQAFSEAGQNALTGGLRSTEVEVGKYVADDVFLSLLLRPFGGKQFSGFRVEWRLSDEVGVQGFVESQVSQLGASGFDELIFTLRQVIGLRLFREWGY